MVFSFASALCASMQDIDGLRGTLFVQAGKKTYKNNNKICLPERSRYASDNAAYVIAHSGWYEDQRKKCDKYDVWTHLYLYRHIYPPSYHSCLLPGRSPLTLTSFPPAVDTNDVVGTPIKIISLILEKLSACETGRAVQRLVGLGTLRPTRSCFLCCCCCCWPISLYSVFFSI